MATTQVTITKKQENKGACGILDLTSTLGQVLKQFNGIEGKVLPDTDGLTVEGWMSCHGVERKLDKNGRKGAYTPANLMKGWHSEMKCQDSDGKVSSSCVFKNVPAKILVGEPNDPDAKAYRVFTKEEAEKVGGKPISTYKLVTIASNKWSVRDILKGLRQSANYVKESEKASKKAAEWDAIDKVYIVLYTKTENGIERKVKEVNKADVIF